MTNAGGLNCDCALFCYALRTALICQLDYSYSNHHPPRSVALFARFWKRTIYPPFFKKVTRIAATPLPTASSPSFIISLVCFANVWKLPSNGGMFLLQSSSSSSSNSGLISLLTILLKGLRERCRLHTHTQSVTGFPLSWRDFRGG